MASTMVYSMYIVVYGFWSFNPFFGFSHPGFSKLPHRVFTDGTDDDHPHGDHKPSLGSYELIGVYLKIG